jgi:DNA-binding LytR/AlgR family response regulator
MSCVFIKGRDHYERVEVDDIIYLSAKINYTHIIGKREYLVSINLGKVFAWLSKFDKEKKLLQINRSTVVNCDYIEGINGNLLYVGDKTFQVGRGYRRVLDRFNVLTYRG